MKTELSLQNNCEHHETPALEDFQRWVDAANTEYQNAEVCIRIVESDEIQQLNSQYRDKDKPTNVLSFAYAAEENFEHFGDEPLYLGDIILCADVVEAESTTQQKILLDHYAHLCIHGVLHLLGYDHQTEQEANVMERLEIKLLKGFNINNPYQVTNNGN